MPTAKNPPATFVGGYVAQIVDIATASLLSGVHAIVLGAPGWGKTRILQALAKRIVPDAHSIIKIEPTTPPEVVHGAYDPAALLNGKLMRVTSGTPYDPTIHVTILDELGRANDALFDALLHPMGDDIVTCLATSNFVPQGGRVQALIDRIGLWLWLQPDPLDSEAIGHEVLKGLQTGLTIPSEYRLPTWKEVEDIRGMVPNEKTIGAITEVCRALADEATAQKHRPNPRALTYWHKILYRYAAWQIGKADFTSLPLGATRILRYAWPATSPEEAATWGEIATAVVDATGAAIEEVLIQIKAKMSAVVSEPLEARKARLATISEEGSQSLRQVGGHDPRVAEAEKTIKHWLGLVAQGNPLQ